MSQFVLAFTFAAACGFAVLIAPGAHAAVLSFGAQHKPYGGNGCADVTNANIAPGTPVDDRPCTAALNQQWEFDGLTIYGLGAQRCLDAVGGPGGPGTKVDSFTCTGAANQQWYYANGQIITNSNGLCLDAGGGTTGTQLIVNTCNGSNNQQWQIK